MLTHILTSVLMFLGSLAAVASPDLDSLFSLWKESSGRQRVSLQQEILQEDGTQGSEAEVLTTMCYHYMDREDFDAALDCAMVLLPILEADGDKEKLADCLNELGVICQRKGLLGQAISYMERVYTLDCESGNRVGMSSTMNNLATLYLAADQEDQALDYILEAIAIERENGNRERLAIRLGLASDIYLKMGDTENALRYVEEAYSMDNEDGREARAAIRLSQKASVLFEKGQVLEAERCVSQAVPVLDAAHRLTSLAICYNQLGAIHKQSGHLRQSAEDFGKALEYAEAAGSDYVKKKALSGLWQAQKSLGQTAEALATLEIYSTLSERLAEDRVDSAVEDFRVRYETQQKEDEIAVQKALGKARMRVIISLVAILLLLLGLLLAVWRMLAVKKRQALTLADNLEVKNRLLSLVPTISDPGESSRLKEIIDGIETMADVPALTRREKEVVALCCEGLQSKEIADRLNVSVRTIDAHKANIFKKLGISSTVELVRIASRLLR